VPDGANDTGCAPASFRRRVDQNARGTKGDPLKIGEKRPPDVARARDFAGISPNHPGNITTPPDLTKSSRGTICPKRFFVTLST